MALPESRKTVSNYRGTHNYAYLCICVFVKIIYCLTH